jgi:hypothetical protein
VGKIVEEELQKIGKAFIAGLKIIFLLKIMLRTKDVKKKNKYIH